MTADEFKVARRKLMLSEAELAVLLRVTPMAVKFWERGLRSVPGPAITLIKILVKYPGMIPEIREGEL